jgi:hypothetical protein
MITETVAPSKLAMTNMGKGHTRDSHDLKIKALRTPINGMSRA